MNEIEVDNLSKKVLDLSKLIICLSNSEISKEEKIEAIKLSKKNNLISKEEAIDLVIDYI